MARDRGGRLRITAIGWLSFAAGACGGSWPLAAAQVSDFASAFGVKQPRQCAGWRGSYDPKRHNVTANCRIAKGSPHGAGPARACPAHLIEHPLFVCERARRFGVDAPIAVDVVVAVAQH